MNPCECGHIYTYHNEKGCGGTVEFKGVAVRNFKPCGCTHYRAKTDENLEMDARAGESDYSHSLIFTSDKFIVTAFGHDREHCEDVLDCVLRGRFGHHEGDREFRRTG